MRILMIDDDRELCAATALVLKKSGYAVDLCYDGEEGLSYLTQNAYDLALLDRLLPRIDGVALLAAARKRDVTTPILMLTALGGVEDRVAGLDAGADDYLAKPFDMRELLARVRALARRPGQLETVALLHYRDLTLDASSLTLRGQHGSCTTSRKEAELLAVLIKHADQVLPREMLFGRVWGAFADVDMASLDSYIHFVRRRLRSVSSEVRITTLRGIGYRLGGQ